MENFLKISTVPALALIVGGTLYPIYKLVELSLFEVRGLRMEYTFVGLKNFQTVFQDPLFVNSLQITAFFTITSVVIEIILGTILAVLIAELKSQILQKFFLFILSMTFIISPVAVALIWRFILYPDLGLIDFLTTNIFNIQIRWLGDPFWAKISAVIVDVWHWTSFVVLIVYAGYISLPLPIFEAAQIDGATGFQRFFRISLPLLKPTIAVALFFRTIDVLQAFPELWQLTFGGPAFATTILNILAYIATFQMMNVNYAAIVSLVLAVISLGVTAIYALYLRRRGE